MSSSHALSGHERIRAHAPAATQFLEQLLVNSPNDEGSKKIILIQKDAGQSEVSLAGLLGQPAPALNDVLQENLLQVFISSHFLCKGCAISVHIEVCCAPEKLVSGLENLLLPANRKGGIEGGNKSKFSRPDTRLFLSRPDTRLDTRLSSILRMASGG
jgi:hypothetical protein